jgi:putative hemolysin
MNLHVEGVSLLLFAALPVFVAATCYLFFIAASLGIARSSITRLEEMLEEGATGAQRALKILKESDRYLLCTQFGRLLSSITAGFSLALCVRGVGKILSGDQAGAQSASFVVSGIIVVVVLAALLVLVQVTKAVSLQYPERMLCRVSGALRVVFSIFGPILVFAHRAIARVLNRFNIKVSNEREIAVSADDLSEIVKMSSEKGTIEKDEQALLEGVVELSDRVTREVMTPRSDIVWVREGVSGSELVGIFTREGVSRVLVCGKDLDEVRGILLAKDLFPYVGKTLTGVDWRSFIRPAYFVPDTKPVKELLKELRQQGIHLAVVLNEHGGVDGIVTLEDLVEEIVGEIFDEFDSPAERGGMVSQRDGALIVEGTVPTSRISEDIGVAFPDGEYDTVAGFIMSHLGRLPAEGESFDFEGWAFVVSEVHKHRINRVALRKLPSSETEGAQEDESLEAVNASGRHRR